MYLTAGVWSNNRKSRPEWCLPMLPRFLRAVAQMSSRLITGCLPIFPTFFQHVGRRTATWFSHRRRDDSPGDDATKKPDIPLHQRSAMKLVPRIDRQLGDLTHPYSGCQLQVYQGGSYATAKANVGEKVVGEEETRPGDMGIIKTVEVDVESAPNGPPSVKLMYSS